MTQHKLITRQQFAATKKSDTLVVYGCGYSINDLTAEQRAALGRFDSIGFNWFCFSGIPTTHYLIREQAIGGQIGRETRKGLTDLLAIKYAGAAVVAVNLRTSTKMWARGFDWAAHVNTIRNPVIVANEAPGKLLWPKSEARYRTFCEFAGRYNPFVQGLLYEFCTMTSVLHLARFMGYRAIIFAGVDLYDHRYFWLKKDQLREVTLQRGRTLEQRHHVADYTVSVVAAYRDLYPDTRLSVVNPKSLLVAVVPVWEM